MASRRTSYSVEELDELSAGLGRLLDSIENGMLEAERWRYRKPRQRNASQALRRL